MTAQHVVTMPDRSPHRAVKIGDALLLLMDTKIIAQGTDWRFLNELKRELKG